MRVLLLVTAAWFCGVAVADEAHAKTVVYSIVIGNNSVPATSDPNQLQPLRYADDDAVRYHQLLSRLGMSRLLVVLDKTTQRRYPGLATIAESPTLTNLRQVVATYSARMVADKSRGDRPVLYFAFSGHGASDGEGKAFLAMADGALSQDVLFDEVIAKLPTTYSHIIIDACNAGGVVGVRGGFFDAEIDAQTIPVSPSAVRSIHDAQRLAQFPHVGVILATTLGKESHEWSELESGVFTHELLSGLLGPADVNGDSRVEYTEVQAFVSSANRGIKDPRAIPHIIARPPRANQNVPLVSLSAISGTRILKGKVADLGHFYVELDNGQRYLDAHLAAGSEATVLLPVGRRAFLRTDDSEARIPDSELVALDELQLSRRKIAARGSIDATYRRALFSSQYGRNYYQGYVDSIFAVGVVFPEPVSLTRALDPDRTMRGSKAPAIAFASLSGVGLVAAMTTGLLAFRAKNDFDGTSLQRPAQSAKQRYERYRAFSVAMGGGSIAAGVAAWWLWPKPEAMLVPAFTTDGRYLLSIGSSW